MGSCSREILRLYKEGKVSQTTLIKMAAFKEEFEKKALGLSQVARKGMSLADMGTLLLTGAALGLGGVIGKEGIDTIIDKVQESHKEPLFEEMLKMHPELASEDQQKVQNYFNTVWHFSPHLARNPFAAGAYIRQALLLDTATGGPNITQTEGLVNIQRLHAQGKDKGDTLGGILFRPVFESSGTMKVGPSELFGTSLTGSDTNV